MWRFRLLRVLWNLLPILWSYALQRGLSRLFPRSPRVAARWARTHERNAARLERACTRLGGVFIKLGQVLSVMGTFLPSVYAQRLERLQDAVPPKPWRVIRRSLRESLGDKPVLRFRSFTRTPLAAGSLAQVHAAELEDGRKVAVKVRYPDLEKTMKVDMKVLGWVVRALQKRAPIARLDRVLQQLDAMLAREIDLGHEAACIARMRAALGDEPGVRIPEVVSELSGPTVLTMSYMEGVKLTDAGGLAALGFDGTAVATRLVQLFFRTVFRERYFHADPHPGNLLVRQDEHGGVELVLLDLGSATRLRDELADGLWDVIEGLLREDEARFLRGLETMGFMSEDGDRELLVRTLRGYFGRILTLEIHNFASVSDREVQKLDIGLTAADTRAVMRSIQYPLGWYELERSIVIVFGLVTQLAPTLNLVQVGVPYVLPLLAQRRAAEAKARAA